VKARTDVLHQDSDLHLTCASASFGLANSSNLRINGSRTAPVLCAGDGNHTRNISGTCTTRGSYHGGGINHNRYRGPGPPFSRARYGTLISRLLQVVGFVYTKSDGTQGSVA
jgi:hypothetical protein